MLIEINLRDMNTNPAVRQGDILIFSTLATTILKRCSKTQSGEDPKDLNFTLFRGLK